MHRYSEVSLTFFNRKEVLKKPQKEDTVRRPHENRRMIFIPQPNDPSSGIGFKSPAGHTAAHSTALQSTAKSTVGDGMEDGMHVVELQLHLRAASIYSEYWHCD
jgi:hypothetical protein